MHELALLFERYAVIPPTDKANCPRTSRALPRPWTDPMSWAHRLGPLIAISSSADISCSDTPSQEERSAISREEMGFQQAYAEGMAAVYAAAAQASGKLTAGDEAACRDALYHMQHFGKPPGILVPGSIART